MLDYFNAIVSAQNETHRAQALEDWHNDMAGRVTGRIIRTTLRDEDGNAIRGREGRKQSSPADITLDILLSNPGYAALHAQTMERLRSTETNIDNALEQLTEKLGLEEAALEDIASKTATLPDGTKVVRDESGNVWTLDDQPVPEDIGALVEWGGNEPSREDFITQKQKIEEITVGIHQLRQDQVRLGEIRESMTNNDKPPSPDEMEGYREEIIEIDTRAEQIIAAPNNEVAVANVDQPHTLSATVSVPDL